jgi:DNA-binding NarL/FixJ family response regulator
MARRVFLVEDLQNMHTLLADLFATMGGLAIVATAGTEAEAKLWLDENPQGWDLSIVDLVLAQGSGMGVVSHARRTPASNGKVIVFSSYASPGIHKHCLFLGADAVFDKSEPRNFVEWLRREIQGEARAE